MIFRDAVRSEGSAIFPGLPVNMLQSGPSSIHPDLPWASAQVREPERGVFVRSEKMSISGLRRLRLPVYANSCVKMTFTQRSRHPWEGVPKFSARFRTWLRNGSDKCLKIVNRQISHLLDTGVTLMAKSPPGSRSVVGRPLDHSPGVYGI